jgi:hypothetical protein
MITRDKSLRMPVLLAIGVAVLATSPVLAADVRAQLTPELIWQHCAAHGVGSPVDGVWMLPNGERVSGTITCTDADMVQPAGALMRRGDDDDEDEGDDD